MNCGVCSAYLAFTHGVPKKRGKITHCSGCRARRKQCAWLKGNCRFLRNEAVEFCFQCPDFPCDRLVHLDHRYRTAYGTSFIRNLEQVRDLGIDRFLDMQKETYTCGRCGQDFVCVHNRKCYRCDKVTSWR